MTGISAVNPSYSIDPAAFWADPYPDLEKIQQQAPAVHVPELNAVLITRRDDIFTQEKRVEVFSSVQPDGLMTVLMGQNMMRKDFEPHQSERRVLLTSLNPKTVRDHWRPAFAAATDQILETLAPAGQCDLVTDFAMPVCGEALKTITGLTSMTAADMDRVSQHMLDGCANYTGNEIIEQRCHTATRFIDEHIDRMLPECSAQDIAPALRFSALAVQLAAGLDESSIRANIKLIISGGQNEPRDAIAGTSWALLTHPQALAAIESGKANWLNAFEEYGRWVSPIGMSPRQVAKNEQVLGYNFQAGERVFFMFGAANRDPETFEQPERYDIHRNTRHAVTFGAGPHFCAGAAASRALIADIALPRLFGRFKRLRLAGEVAFGGWAFRGPLTVPVAWG